MTTNFTNPILEGFNPDPSVARAAEDFFLTTSTFDYFPGLPIYHSRDLVNWKLIGHALSRKSQLDMRTGEPGAGVWAPTLRWRKNEGGEQGRFYIATCKWDRYRPKNDERIFPRGFYVYTDNIWDDNSWSEPIYFDNPGFDQDLFWDDNGKVYLSTTTRLAKRLPDSQLKDFAIHISEVDLRTGRTLTAPEVIRASPCGIAEGSHIIKRGKFYYLFTAEGGTESGHQEWVFRSDKGPMGPWELGPRNPLWYNGTDDEVQNTGHVDLFDDSNGNWWAVLLGVRPRNLAGKWEESPLGRETFLVRVHWEDNWPVFNYGRNISILTVSSNDQKEQIKLMSPIKSLVWEPDFSKNELELGWYQKNTPLKPFYSLSERPGHLRLHGDCYPLSSPEAPCIVLMKQTALYQWFRAILEFRPKRAGYEAGIVAWWSMYSYASIGISFNEENGMVTLVEKGPSYEKETAMVSSDLYELWIEASPKNYRLSIGDSSSGMKMCREIPVSSMIISPPVGGAFTGMMFGLYSFGKGEPCLDPADFSYVARRLTKLET